MKVSNQQIGAIYEAQTVRTAERKEIKTQEEQKCEFDSFEKSGSTSKADVLGDFTEKDRRNMLIMTLKLGNSMFFKANEKKSHPEFNHDYSLKYIELDEDAINTIEANKHQYIFINSMSA